MSALRCSCALRTRLYQRQRPQHLRRVPGAVVRASASAADSPATSSVESLQYQQVLVAILDANPFLSDGSKTAVATSAMWAKQFNSKVTVLVVDEPGTDNTDPARRIESINWHLRQRGCEEYQVVERAITSPASVLLGDFADEINADVVVLSSEAVHAKHVDANQLAEFVSCPVLLLP